MPADCSLTFGDPSSAVQASAMLPAHDQLASRFRDALVMLWLAVMPITSVLVLPGVQGTTPATLCAIVALGVALLSRSTRDQRLLGRLVLFVLLFGILQFASALAAMQLPMGLYRLLIFTNEPVFGQHFLGTVATQSAYLGVGVVTALFAMEWSDRRWSNWVFAGPLLLVAYGFYEWCYFLLFQESGDFLSNRTFSVDAALDAAGASGSLVQTTEPLGFPMLRLKSLTGEPSMFALATLPYFFLALCTGRRWIAGILLASLLLSTSSTALLCLPLGLILCISFRPQGWQLSHREWTLAVLVGALLLAVLFFLPSHLLLDYFATDLGDKLSGQGTSGEERLESLQQSIEFVLRAPWPIQLFGIGFGVARPLSFFLWLLINGGLVGAAAWIGFFLWPVARMSSSDGMALGLKVALVVTLVAMLAGVPEFSYPTIWLFLGLAYARLAGGNDAH